MSVRYHAVSLVAVFLALTAGMVIGALFLQSPALNTTRNVIGNLRVQAAQQRTDLNTARTQHQETRDQLLKLAAVFSPLLKGAAAGRLAGRRVAIVQVGDYPDATAAVASAIQMAGGTISVTATLDAATLTEANQKAALALLSGMAHGLNPEQFRPLTGATLSQETLRVPPTRLVVVVGGHKQMAEPAIASLTLESAMLDALQSQGDLRAVGVEPLEVDLSSVSTYTAKDIPSVDCIDLPIGQIALPFALAGESGAFGLKKTAEALMPEPAFAALFVAGAAGE